MKNCPFCVQPIQADALKCRFCQRWLVDRKEKVKVSSLLKALLLFVLDGFFFQQGVITFIAAIICVPKLIDAVLKKDIVSMKREGIFVLTVVLLFSFIISKNYIARYRTEKVIKICNEYKDKYGHYPEKLEDLVPEYYSKVPSAKFGMWGKYWYSSYAGNHSIMYIAIPPFGRPYFKLEENKWGYLD